MMQLVPATAFNPGADLWIIPELEFSRSAQKLDWYLNFQVSKSNRHATLSLAPELTQLMADCDLSSPRFHFENDAPLMIASAQFVPARWVVLLNGAQNSPEWCQSIEKVWTALGKPLLRVFLPVGLGISQFQTQWRKSQSFDDFSVVLD